MKKLLFMIFTPRFSGAEVIIKNLIEHNSLINSYSLVSQDYKDSICPNMFRSKYIGTLNRESNNRILIFLKITYNVLGLTKTLFLLHREHKFDIIYANNITLASYAILSRVLFYLFFPQVEFIWHNHNINYLNSVWDKKIEKVLSKIFSKTIVVSKAVYKNMSHTNSLRVLYNGIDTDLFKIDYEIKKKLKAQHSLEDKIIIGVFGTISNHKGQIQLIHAFKKIAKNFDSVHLLIIGSFETEEIRERVYEFARNLGKEKITILNYVENIYDYYSLIDILVNNTSNTLSEPLGTTILEGMATENIVVASETGGTPEIIEDGINGFMFKPDNIIELEKKLNYVLNNLSELKYIRYNARKRIVEKFKINNMVKSFNYIVGVQNDENT